MTFALDFGNSDLTYREKCFVCFLVKCDPARWNAELIIQYTSASPFRLSENSFMCVYCGDLFVEPELFRQHVAREHTTFRPSMAFAKLPRAEFVKADITGLRCRLCTQQHHSLQSIAKHLNEAHEKEARLDSPLGVQPYRLEKDNWSCAVCGKDTPSLQHLNRHTVSHFLSFVCEICAKSYVNSSGLLTHVRSTHEREYRACCKGCRAIFPSMREKLIHQRTAKRCMTHCCTECPERFPSYVHKQRHMAAEHGLSAREYSCSRCQLSFGKRQGFYDHYRVCHSGDGATCVHCGHSFPSPSKLKKHLRKHAA